MPEITGLPQSRLEPAPAWTLLTDSPLRGISLAREGATLLAWDEGDRVYLIDTSGRQRNVVRAPARLITAAISDNGSLVVLLVEGPRLVFLNAKLEPTADRTAPGNAPVLAVDPHGRYAALAVQTCTTYLFTLHGRPAGTFETRQVLAHLAFVPDRPFLVGAAAFGYLFGIDLRPGGGGSGRLSADVAWEEALLSNVGRLTTSGDGNMILASCYTHGVQRFDIKGRNEGAYHLGGTVSHAVPDFAARVVGVATLEGDLVVLTPGGNVRWQTNLPRPVHALETDPLGRFFIYAHATGEIVRLDLEPASEHASPRLTPPVAAARSIRPPDWSTPVVKSDVQAETAVLTVLDDPPRIGLLSSGNRLQVFTCAGQNLGFAPEVQGIGRILRTASGWIASATDRQIALYDARRNVASRVDLSLAELTHLVIRPDTFGLGIVQERDRVGRATLAGRWVWKKELRSAVEDLAIGPEGHAALTREDGRLDVYDPAGGDAGCFDADPSEPLCLIEAPESSPTGVTWLTLARRAQVLRGHDLQGRVLWESPTPWEGWQLQRLGPLAVVSAPDGRALVYDGGGKLIAQDRSHEGGAVVFGHSPGVGVPWRVICQDVHLICSELSGNVLWRHVADEPFGPIASGSPGVAVLIGRSLAWFKASDP